MKKFEGMKSTKLPEIIFAKDDSLARFKGRNLFPEKVVRAKEDFKNIVLHLR
jgi:hypothetical protein